MLQTLRAPIYLPRANTDPVSSPHAALAVFSLALRRPLCDEILVLMLDNQLRGIGLMSFDAVASISNNINHAIGLCSSVLNALPTQTPATNLSSNFCLLNNTSS